MRDLPWRITLKVFEENLEEVKVKQYPREILNKELKRLTTEEKVLMKKLWVVQL